MTASTSFEAGPWDDLYVEGRGGGAHIESLGREVPHGWGLFLHTPRMSEDAHTVYMGQPVSFSMADVRLIAAAPDMFLVLEAIVNAADRAEVWPAEFGGPLLDEARAALKKAKQQ